MEPTRTEPDWKAVSVKPNRTEPFIFASRNRYEPQCYLSIFGWNILLRLLCVFSFCVCKHSQATFSSTAFLGMSIHFCTQATRDKTCLKMIFAMWKSFSIMYLILLIQRSTKNEKSVWWAKNGAFNRISFLGTGVMVSFCLQSARHPKF